MMTMRKAPRFTNEEDKGEETLDANLWGQLQEHIPLQTIYEKLLQRDLFHLRLVNKEWKHVALQWILPKSSFVTIAPPYPFHWGRQFRNRIVTYNSASGEVKFNRQHLLLGHAKTHVSPFEVEGLILCHNPDDLKEQGVFNVHTQTWHAIHARLERSKTLSVCGLVVDTIVKPYTFKLIEGNINFMTQIYDSKSRSWSKTLSWLPSSTTESRLDTLEYSCICNNNNNVYMSLGWRKILKYSVEDDKWTKLKIPNVVNFIGYLPHHKALEVWAWRIFTTTKKPMSKDLLCGSL